MWRTVRGFWALRGAHGGVREGTALPDATHGGLPRGHGQQVRLFEDENYAGFVGWMKSVLDFEHFHGMMCDAAKANLESRRHK